MSTDLVIKESAVAIDTAVEKYGPAALAQIKSQGQMMLATSAGIQAIRNAITDDMVEILSGLQNSRLGFLTDNRDGYKHSVIREVACEALLKGARMTGNEVNIIRRNCYLTKEFFQRATREYPGVANLKKNFNITKKTNDFWVIDCEATWKQDGQDREYQCQVTLPQQKGDSPDSLFGKAERRLLARVLENMSGQSFADGDVNETVDVVYTDTSKNPSAAPSKPSAETRLEGILGNARGPVLDDKEVNTSKPAEEIQVGNDSVDDHLPAKEEETPEVTESVIIYDHDITKIDLNGINEEAIEGALEAIISQWTADATKEAEAIEFIAKRECYVYKNGTQVHLSFDEMKSWASHKGKKGEQYRKAILAIAKRIST